MTSSLLLFLGLPVVLKAFVPSYTPSNMGGAVGCVVTGNRLFSAGNYIRELNSAEMEQLGKYKKDLAQFQQKIDEAFEQAEEVEKNNSTVPPMPVRPTMPGFCSGSDTTLYIFGGCTVQNHKVYVGKTLARDLNEIEKKKLTEFIAKMGKENKVPADLQKGLDFCTEF